MSETFSQFLRKEREKRGYSIRQLAMYSGISAPQISRIENSLRGVPKPETIKKLAEGLKMPYEKLMEAAGYLENDDNTNDTDQPAELTEFLKNANVMFHGVPMTEEDKRRVEDVLTGLFWHAKERKQKEGLSNDPGKGKTSGKSTRNE